MPVKHLLALSCTHVFYCTWNSLTYSSKTADSAHSPACNSCPCLTSGSTCCCISTFFSWCYIWYFLPYAVWVPRRSQTERLSVSVLHTVERTNQITKPFNKLKQTNWATTNEKLWAKVECVKKETIPEPMEPMSMKMHHWDTLGLVKGCNRVKVQQLHHCGFCLLCAKSNA